MKIPEINLRELTEIEEFYECLRLQREVFGLPETEISPVRHFVVAKHAGGFTLGAFAGKRLAGFVLANAAFDGAERFFYSHIAGVSRDFQNAGVGAKLKWAQREEALKRGVKLIKWTFQPVMARNAYFNLEKLGAIVCEYKANFYGADYATAPEQTEKIGLDSDRLFAEWRLESERVKSLFDGEKFMKTGEPARKIEIPNDWNKLLKTNPQKAIAEQNRVKNEFQAAFAENLIAKGFVRSETNPHFLLFKN